MKKQYLYLIILAGFFLLPAAFENTAQAQTADTVRVPPMPTMQEIMKDWGPRDSTKVAAIWYGPNYDSFKMMPYTEEQNIWVSKLPPDKLEKIKQEWNRLRNAVYVCYPYALTASAVIDNISRQLQGVADKSARKAIIKSREQELKKKFGDPLSNLSVYQGKVLMKLIYRQTGADCYEIIKEYKGGLNARLYQTVAFFYGGSLKQDYDIRKNSFDRQIEDFVQEINATWYHNPYRVR
ncbi:DUF4294 domain-containing protein [Niabella soli]|uniref:DUF4294 domain-containing protein n=1 Tax=Niabella soli DSM 19437 TaxID=929713 RepID=W0F0A5_9BACT|nr:DUF4294 domain-containing protein [Niabella soli]AHF14879.1 hypothetical protein NIASO_06325 [Niabella soli DSM 19437]